MKSLTSYFVKESSNDRVSKIWDALIEWNVATKEELELVTDILGYSENTLNKVIYARCAMHDIEQLAEEEGYEWNED